MKIKELLIKNWLLIVILLIVSVIRLWNLGNIPPHLTPDEASLGYNAYSILKTGKDEYGNVFPLIFKSFGDYKPGLYVYLTVPSVLLFGLNEFAVRFPSALFGIISVLLIYLITRKLFPDYKKLPIIVAFIAAINPWLVQFSRGGWEVNVALCLTLFGIYFFFKSFDKSKDIITSIVFFALTLLVYQGAKLSTGIVVLLLIGIYWKSILGIERRKIVTGLILGIVISLPIILSFFTGKTGRLNVFSVFSYPRPKEYLQNFLDQGNEKVGSVKYFIYHSEILNFKRGVLGRYFNHFSGKFLFFDGDWSNPRHSPPNHGMLLLTDVVLLLLGAAVLIRKKVSREILFVWLWLFLSSLPSVLSRDQVHAVRALNMVVPLIVILSLGLDRIIKYLKTNKFRLFLSPLFSFIYLIGIVYYLDSYFVHLSAHTSNLWEYGYKQIVETVTPIQGNYKKIKVQQSYAQPYIFFLFFQKYDPVKYQKQANLVTGEYVNDVGLVTKLDNIEFVPIDWSVSRGNSNTLFVADTIRIPPEDSKDESLFKLIREIKYLNGRDTAFRIIEVK